MVWKNAQDLVKQLALRAQNDHQNYIQSKNQFTKKHRKVRVLNIELWDSCLAFESYSFKGNVLAVNPRNFMELNKDANVINYDLDSEDELEERLGEDAESFDDSSDLEFHKNYNVNLKEDD